MGMTRCIGWVGLGAIGTQMVKRVLSTGQMVTVYPRGVGLEEVTADGAKQGDGYASLAALSDVLVLCVYSDEQVIDIVYAEGALAAMRPGSTLVIHTTGSPATIRDISARAPEGVSVIDACFSGGPLDAAEGRLTIMAGADASSLESIDSLLRCYANQVHHLGPPGHGQAIKVLNNLLFATNYMNALEMLRLADAQGFRANEIAKVVEACSGSSYAMALFTKAAVPEAMDQAIRPYMQKDVATAIRAARDAGLDTACFTAAARYFQP